MVDWVPRSSCLHKPHLSYSISVLQKFSNALCQVHWQAAIHGLWYLAGTTNYGFSFKAGIEWVGYSHANWAGDADTWWPASGYCLILGSGLSLGSPKTIFSLIFFYKSWISCLFGYMLQTLVVKDTFLTILEFHKLLLFEISNSSFHGRNKHIKVQYYFVLELVASQIIRLDYCATRENVANLFNNPLLRDIIDQIIIHLNVGTRFWSWEVLEGDSNKTIIL